MRPGRWLAAALAATVVVAGGQVDVSGAAVRSPAAPATLTSSPGDEAAFISRINSLRASQGLPQLAVYGELTSVARRWTDRMVQNGQISHNPNLGSEVSANWTKIGENVGVGYDVDGLMEAFKNSPAHYRNLVDPDWNYVGVGVTIAGDGRMYTTHNFMRLEEGGGPAPTPAPAPAPTPRPRTPRASTTAPTAGSTTPTTVAPAPPPKPKPEAQRVATVLAALRTIAG